VPYLKEAVAIDPDFALAYGQLGIFYEDLGKSLLATTSTARAFQRHEHRLNVSFMRNLAGQENIAAEETNKRKN
jgi:hypothetical protein